MAGWETVIGLECHVELSTETKMFCSCRNEFGAEPNANTCPVCLGHPGSLPVPNREAIARIIRIGLALDSEIAPHSLFHRKNYFYPDMPKNYQISQYDLPICVGGHLDVELPDGTTSRVGITRVHMEEDTGKTTHGSASGRIHEAEDALVDYNRAGVPLVECVSEPDMRSPEEAAAYLRELRATLEALDVSDVKMEEGSLRCDANVSLRPEGSDGLGTKVEIKNMNSVRSLERALTFEVARQTKALDNGETIVQETRHWDEDAGATRSMRSKEEAFDYRYFPEPDIPALEPDAAWIDEIRASLPELPRARRERYVTEMGLKPKVALVLVADRAACDLFERSMDAGEADPTTVANWITQDISAHVRERGWTFRNITPEVVVELIKIDEKYGRPQAKRFLSELVSRQGSIDISGMGSISISGRASKEIIDSLGLRSEMDTDALGEAVDQAIAANPDVVEKFRGGNQGVLGFLVGQVMKATGGAANPKVVQELLRERLG
jgi:aspartyl-tRNA(Asn)/glutamyl-tRNA(Gln) amidotransferase subunit B